MTTDICTPSCLHASDPNEDVRVGLAKFHNCMTDCRKEDAQALKKREQHTIEVERARRCDRSASAFTQKILREQFITPANAHVMPLLQDDQNEAAGTLTSSLYRSTYLSLMESSDAFVKMYPECVGFQYRFAKATHDLLDLKYRLLFKGEDIRLRWLGQDPSQPSLDKIVDAHFASVTGAGLGGISSSLFFGFPFAITAGYCFSIAELTTIGISYLIKSEDLERPLEMLP